jgi:hypothetical protein
LRKREPGYLNSVLQLLFHSPGFRPFVYELATTGDEDWTTSVPLALQRLFCCMEHSPDSACSTKYLMQTFGWDSPPPGYRAFIRSLFSHILNPIFKPKKAVTFPFRERVCRHLRALHVAWEHDEADDFTDIALDGAGCATFADSFSLIFSTVTQRDTGTHGTQEVEVQLTFSSLPRVLLIHCENFSGISLPAEFEFLPGQVYDLFGVLGDSAFLRPDHDWYEFDDTTITATASLPLSPYLLAYSQRGAVKAVRAPSHVRCFAELAPDCAVKRVCNVVLASEDCIRQCGAFSCPELHRTIAFISGVDSVQVVYKRVARLFGIDRRELRLWRVGDAHFTPQSCLKDTPDETIGGMSARLFVQRGKLRLDDATVAVFVVFTHPTLAIRRQYVGCVAARRGAPYRTVFPKIAEMLGWRRAEFVIAGNGGQNAPAGGGAVLLNVELPSGTQLPPTAHPWTTQLPLPKGEIAEEVELRVCDIAAKGDWVEAVVFRFEEPEKPVVRVRFLSQVHLKELIEFVIGAIGESVEEGETVSLIKQRGDAGVMGQGTVGDHMWMGVHYDFLDLPAGGRRIWVKRVRA